MQIQGRVLDSSIYGWVADVAVTLSGAGYATLIYVDGSLATRDVSINDNLVSIININSSLGTFELNVDASFADVYTELDLKADLTYVDGSVQLLV